MLSALAPLLFSLEEKDEPLALELDATQDPGRRGPIIVAGEGNPLDHISVLAAAFSNILSYAICDVAYDIK